MSKENKNPLATAGFKNLLWVLCLCLFLAQTACKPSAMQNKEPKKEASLLWEITGKGIKKSYLFGTVHIANEKVLAMSDLLLDEIESCQVLAGELVMDEKAMQQALMPMLSQMFMKDTTLEMLLSKEEFAIVEKKIEDKLGMMAPAAMKMKPLFITVMLSEQGQGSSKKSLFDFGKGEPVDMYLQKKAKEKNKEVVGLETIDEQMGAFNSISLQEQAKMLYRTVIGEEKESNTNLDQLLSMYYRQEIDSLYELTQGSLSDFSNKSLLVERNQRMADRMEKIMKDKKLFTAVGAAHLAGEKGVIGLLRKKGYLVKAKKL
jgi:uncharacterized protein YbaP (TraB family)